MDPGEARRLALCAAYKSHSAEQRTNATISLLAPTSSSEFLACRPMRLAMFSPVFDRPAGGLWRADATCSCGVSNFSHAPVWSVRAVSIHPQLKSTRPSTALLESVLVLAWLAAPV